MIKVYAMASIALLTASCASLPPSSLTLTTHTADRHYMVLSENKAFVQAAAREAILSAGFSRAEDDPNERRVITSWRAGDEEYSSIIIFQYTDMKALFGVSVFVQARDAEAKLQNILKTLDARLSKQS
jgi:hypothetical protein